MDISNDEGQEWTSVLIPMRLDPADKSEKPDREFFKAAGRRGGLKGGKARAAKMTAEQRSESARKAVNAYKKATGDMRGEIELLLTYAETGTQFTLDFGDIDENFYIRLETALENAAEALKASPTRNALYAHFRPRFLELQKDAGWMGWGYGDTINEIVGGLEAFFESG